MNPIQFFERQIAEYNKVQQCGFCFTFAAPLFENALNLQQADSGDECCVHVMLTDLTVNHIVERASTGFVSRKICDYGFNLFVLKQSNIGINNYNEIKGHSVDDSKWSTIFEPLMSCFGCDPVLQFCELWGYPIQVTNWRMAMVTNYQDMNYDGYKIQATVRVIT